MVSFLKKKLDSDLIIPFQRSLPPEVGEEIELAFPGWLHNCHNRIALGDGLVRIEGSGKTMSRHHCLLTLWISLLAKCSGLFDACEAGLTRVPGW